MRINRAGACKAFDSLGPGRLSQKQNGARSKNPIARLAEVRALGSKQAPAPIDSLATSKPGRARIALQFIGNVVGGAALFLFAFGLLVVLGAVMGVA